MGTPQPGSSRTCRAKEQERSHAAAEQVEALHGGCQELPAARCLYLYSGRGAGQAGSCRHRCCHRRSVTPGGPWGWGRGMAAGLQQQERLWSGMRWHGTPPGTGSLGWHCPCGVTVPVTASHCHGVGGCPRAAPFFSAPFWLEQDFVGGGWWTAELHGTVGSPICPQRWESPGTSPQADLGPPQATTGHQTMPCTPQARGHIPATLGVSPSSPAPHQQHSTGDTGSQRCTVTSSCHPHS